MGDEKAPASTNVDTGDVFVISTPGGGGYGKNQASVASLFDGL